MISFPFHSKAAPEILVHIDKPGNFRSHSTQNVYQHTTGWLLTHVLIEVCFDGLPNPGHPNSLELFWMYSDSQIFLFSHFLEQLHAGNDMIR